ncbi:hypothetical protein ACH5RR_014916 [Cinchona calisaya]|uniref:Uncharacterized protein n=1 Tax=Cinchona calisaya TaxID=153742 RepID=A0ABD2ZUD0_9GENT
MNPKQNTSSNAKAKMQKEKNSDLERRAREIVQAVTHYSDPEVLAEVSCGLDKHYFLERTEDSLRLLEPFSQVMTYLVEQVEAKTLES